MCRCRRSIRTWSFREFTANRREIGDLSIGLVVATTAVVAVIARMLIPDKPWAVAVALGAIVSPPDAVAAMAVVSRLPVPSRLIVILEGESLVNDASALNALIFIMLGLQFAKLLQPSGIAAYSGAVKYGVIMGVVVMVVMVVRLFWVPVTTICAQSLRGGRAVHSTAGNWKSMFLVSWTSMRGIVSLATAFALPLTLDSGARFPFRDELIIMTTCVILVTLVIQGLSLAPIIHAFKFAPEVAHHEEEQIARQEALRRAAEALEDASREPWADPADVEWPRTELRDRQHRHKHRSHANHGSRSRLRSRMLDAERRMLLRLRNEGAISYEVLRTLESVIDLDTLRLSPSS